MNKVLAFIGALAIATGAWAQQDISPDELVQKITNEVLAALKSDKELAAGDKQKAMKLAEEKVLPYIDFEQSTRLAVGRSWNQASPEQKKKLVGEFRNMLVRTYSNAIGTYQGQTLKVLPSRGRAASRMPRTRRCARSSSAPAASRCPSTSPCARPTRAGGSTTSRSKG
jgi:phospholipid transport system substrate-binding protein